MQLRSSHPCTHPFRNALRSKRFRLFPRLPHCWDFWKEIGQIALEPRDQREKAKKAKTPIYQGAMDILRRVFWGGYRVREQYDDDDDASV